MPNYDVWHGDEWYPMWCIDEYPNGEEVDPSSDKGRAIAKFKRAKRNLFAAQARLEELWPEKVDE